MALSIFVFNCAIAVAADPPIHYYAHDAVLDKNGVIAPWYHGQEGQLPCRIRIAAETLKRYPWSGRDKAAMQVPEYLWSSFWSISPQGDITPGKLTDWMNGDRGQLAMYVLTIMPDYYRYSGDPAALAHALMEADIVLNYGLTPSDHAWPSFPVSVPVKGKPYGQVDPKGMIQLDISAMVGYGMLRTYQLTGEKKLLEAANHWADVFASKCNRKPGEQPWGRYANPETYPSKADLKEINKLTGGVVWILDFLDEAIRLGHRGEHDDIVSARDAAREYFKNTLLPLWAVNDTWGRHYWDWINNVQVPNITGYAVKYMLDHKELFPNWRTDCRNMLALCLNRVAVSPLSNGDVFSGAWAGPESCGCCGRALGALPGLISDAWARYGVEADSEWAREIARRMMILFTYDFHLNGVAEDNIDGGIITNGEWFEAAQMAPMRLAMRTLAWMPETFGAARENHIVRSSSVVNSVTYRKGRINYATFDAPANTLDVLRLSFRPRMILAEGKPLEQRSDLSSNGYTLRELSMGDCIITIRHDAATQIAIEGPDPAQELLASRWQANGQWSGRNDAPVADKSDASASFTFQGNQLRLLGSVSPTGGLADVYLDGQKQMTPIDCWNPLENREGQTLYYTSGLQNKRHEVRIVARGAGNPRSSGTEVSLESVIYSDATGNSKHGESGGPTGAQRVIFGYTKSEDYRDSSEDDWRPAGEFVIRTGAGTDSVAQSWWTEPSAHAIDGTKDPELYRYGVHGHQITAYFTVAPGAYHVRLMFCESPRGKTNTSKNLMNVYLNDERVAESLDVAARAGGINQAFNLDFDRVIPRHGVIAIGLVGAVRAAKDASTQSEAFIQATAIDPQPP